MRSWFGALLCAAYFVIPLSAQEVRITWNGINSSLESYPTQLSATETVTVVISGVNDYLYDYPFTVQATVQPVPGPSDLGLPGPTLGVIDRPIPSVDCATYSTQVAKLIQDLKDPSLNPKITGKTAESIPLKTTDDFYASSIVTDLVLIPSVVPDGSDPKCSAAEKDFSDQKPRLDRLNAASKSPHTVQRTITLSPGYDYKLSIQELFAGNQTDASPRQFTFSPTNDAITISAGVALTWLQSRSYTATTVPNPSVSAAATKSVLVTGDYGAPRPVILALLNYSLFQPKRHSFADVGVGISAGPILQSGGKSDLATLGFFSGVSFSFLHNLYITPGVHVGQYATPPAGLSEGATIPAGLGTLVPVKSYRPEFALGITFRTTGIGAKKVTAKPTTDSAGKN